MLMAELRRTCIEMLLIVAVSLTLGVAVNARNRDGLSLRRNYYPRYGPPSTQATQPGAGTKPATTQATARVDVAALLRTLGLQPLTHDEVVAIYNDPLREVGLHVFIDARDDAHYQAGHIPGAWQLDHYYPERYIDEVLPMARQADKVVVYCTGGDCEDSRLVADSLRGAYALDPMRIFIYVDGAHGWHKAGKPLEKGARGSGDMTGTVE